MSSRMSRVSKNALSAIATDWLRKKECGQPLHTMAHDNLLYMLTVVAVVTKHNGDFPSHSGKYPDHPGNRTS